MARRSRGIKRSSWLTFRRRLLLIRLLLRQPMSGDQLMEAVEAELGDEGYPPAASNALRHDITALKNEFGCSISYQRRSGVYVLEDLGELALLDLPDDCMEALAFIEASFPAGATLPEHANIHRLLNRMMMLLPEHRREQHQQQRSAVELQLLGKAPGKIDPGVLATVKRAIERRKELAFDYLGLADMQPRRHRVAPYRIFFRPEGHGYLDATLLEARPPGPERIHSAIDYRLDRIVPGTVKILPQMLPAQRLQMPAYHIRYRLHASVARRRDVAVYFPDTKIDYHDDGSATVTASVTNLWQARQLLLRYGAGCIVEEPPELVELFRETTKGLCAIYSPGEPQVG
ncbi:MAG: WYL domain-containing protein [Herpetosiphonaceae bacterium]|nr:MAG: WYL domain-containing protein [Herpetosiphonaceae bacterium]